MRHRLLILWVALVLFCTPVHAAAGNADDPLVSKSFVHTWAEQLVNTLVTHTNTLIQEFENRVFGTQARPQWNPGEALDVNATIALQPGASITLLSGSAKVLIAKGSFVNASAGGEAMNGRLRAFERYILCEDSAATITVTAQAKFAIEGSYTVRTPQGTEITPAPTPVTTPTPSPSPAPTPTATPTSTPVLTPLPTATPTPTPTAAPTPAPTPVPTKAPTPTPVVIIIEATPQIVYVTVTPAPTATPVPTATPTPTVRPTAKPNVTANPENKPITFRDVSRDAWFYEELQAAAKADLIPEYMDKEFLPTEHVTLAEAIAMAARLHQLSDNEEITLKDFWLSPWWYKTYRDYGIEEGILPEKYHDYSRKKLKAHATRSELVEIFYGALPEEQYEAINTVPDNAIPDVKDFSDGAEEIYVWYRAGILTGYLDKPGTDDYTFRGYEEIRRNETVVLLMRMLDKDFRVEFELK